MSELFPNLSSVADEMCMIHTLHTEAINHDPALTFMQTGAQTGNRPSMGAWLSMVWAVKIKIFLRSVFIIKRQG